jgi:hypothetical protein
MEMLAAFTYIYICKGTHQLYAAMIGHCNMMLEPALAVVKKTRLFPKGWH